MFNTLRYAKMLEEVGFSRDQAETSIKILVEIMEDKLASKHDLQEHRVAFKQDLQELRVDLQELRVTSKHDLQELRTEVQHSFSQMDAKFAILESKLTVKMGTMLAASIAILTAIQKLT